MDVDVPSMDVADTIVELWLSLAAGQREHGSHLLAAENRTRIRESVIRHIATDQLLVARENGIQGFVMFTIEDSDYEQDVRRGIVENLFVVPGARNEGVGSALIAAAETRLEAHGVDIVTLDVMASNDDAQRFYREHGYEPHRIEFEKRVDGSDLD